MIGKMRNVGQKHMFLPNLVELVNPEHELSLLGGKLDWDGIESGFASLYSDVGCRAKPIRLMVGLLILKQMYDLADETVMSSSSVEPVFSVFLWGDGISVEVSVRPVGSGTFSASDRCWGS